MIMKKLISALALAAACMSANAQVTVWSSGQAIFDSGGQQVDSVSFQKLSKAGTNDKNTGLGYREVKPTYSDSDYIGFCNVIVGSAKEGDTNYPPGVCDFDFSWVEIYDHNGKLIESTDKWTGVYRVPHGGWIIPYFEYVFKKTIYNKITVGTLHKLKVTYIYNKANFYIE